MDKNIGCVLGILLLIFVVALETRPAVAQSFLSSQKTLESHTIVAEQEEDSDEAFEIDLEVVVETPALDQDSKDVSEDALDIDQDQKDSLSAKSRDLSSVSLPEALPEADSPLPVDDQQTKSESGLDDEQAQETTETGVLEEMPLDLESLAKVSLLIKEEEYSLALVTLERMPSKTEKKLEPDEKFHLEELRHSFLIQISFHLGHYEKVIDLSNEYFKHYINGDHYYQIYYLFSASLSYLEKPLELTSLVTEEFFSGLSVRESSNLRRYLIQDALNKNLVLTAFAYLENPEGKIVPGFEKWVGKIVEKIDEIDDVDEILERYKDDLIRSHSYLKKVQLLVRNGDYQEAQDFLGTLHENDELDTKTVGDIQILQNFLNIALNTEPDKIGVILPLSHAKYGWLARQALDGLELALQRFSTGEKPIQLVVKDSALNFSESNTPLRPKERLILVKNQVGELVENDKVIAILGPLMKNTSIVAGETAEVFKVPVISFSKTEYIGKDIPFLFRFQRNQIDEAETLAHYAMDYLFAERFALFYKANQSKSFRVMQAFGKVVKEKGGTIVGVSRIHSKQADFTDTYKSITGGFRKITEEERQELKSERKSTKEPIVDFDAMFVPAAPDTIKVITNFNRYFDAEKVWILSGSEINVRENQKLTHTKRLRFVDAFPIGSMGTYLQAFYEAHWKLYNYRSDYQPPSDYTIFAYEALGIVSKLLNDPKHHNRESLSNAIRQLDEFPVLTGKVRTEANGELAKDLNILMIKRKNTVTLF